MQLGIFAKIFVRPTLEETLDAVRALGVDCLHFNMKCLGGPSMPDEIDPALCRRVRDAMTARGLKMASISGTFNLIHPERSRRRDGLRRLGVLAAACKQLDVSIITLCTGTRDPDDMWRRHPDNDRPEAWRDLVESLDEALAIAEEHNVTLAFETEVANVIDSAEKGCRLLDELRSDRLKVVMDGANLFHAGQLPRMREVLDEAFSLLGPDIVLAHAKDLSRDGEAGQEAAGTGLLDYDYYLSLLDQSCFHGPLLLHSLAESQARQCVAFLREKLGE